MEIENEISKQKELYINFLGFIDSCDASDEEFQSLTKILEKQDIINNPVKIQFFFKLISKITANHHRTSNFFDKIEKIFSYIFQVNPQPIPSIEIIEIFDMDKRILYLLFEKDFITIDDQINKYISKQYINRDKDKFCKYYYLYPTSEDQKAIKYKDEEIIPENCKIGENESYICSLIRQDSVEEFIIFVNQRNISLSMKINSTVYETNIFLIDKTPSLIEYAAFYGSIQIFQYLNLNQVELKSSLWDYAVHSNNPEMIHLIEEIKFNSIPQILNAFYESIKCHHNDIAIYIKDNLLEPKNYEDKLPKIVIDSMNYSFYPDKIEDYFSEEKNKQYFNDIIKSYIQFPELITLPESITSLSDIFCGLKFLTKIKFSSSLKSIAENAFRKCTS